MDSLLVTPEDVLESLMNDGTIDAIRLKIVNQLKANEELKNYTISMVEQSKVLNTPGAEKQTKRELFDALRQELESSVLEKASRAVWELILDNNNLGKEISETVEKVFWRLTGREPPPAMPNGGHGHGQEEREAPEKVEGEKNKERERDEERASGSPESSGRKHAPGEAQLRAREKERASSEALPRKRSFGELSVAAAPDKTMNETTDAFPRTDDRAAPSCNPKT